jgi:hypothetical protein
MGEEKWLKQLIHWTPAGKHARERTKHGTPRNL